MSQIQIRLGGVPEHFNVPIWESLEQDEFKQLGIDLVWRECPGGTGQMMEGLSNGDLDIAISLTEGSIAAIAKGQPLKLVQWYVSTPLLWGIHVAAKSAFTQVAELQHARFAISRYGSGSHLMSYVEAQRQGWEISRTDTDNKANEIRFVVVNDIAGGVKALNNNEADVFLWEQFTTQPYVDQQILRCIGVCPTPWPAFVICARNNLREQERKAVAKCCTHIAQQASSFKLRQSAVDIISKRCGLKHEQVSDWLIQTEWASVERGLIETEELRQIIKTLKQLGIVNNDIAPQRHLF